MKWFRLWVDIIDDHKISRLSPYEFQTFIYLLACASEEDAINGRLTRGLQEINRRIRRRNDHFMKALETFQVVGLITIENGDNIVINNWNKRQFQSDKAYERVKKHRQQPAIRNVSKSLHETPPDTDSDTDTDKPPIVPRKRATDYDAEFLSFWTAYPKKAKKPNAYQEWKKLGSKRPAIGVILAAIANHKTWRPWIEGFIPDPERWLKNERWEDERPPDGGGNGNVGIRTARSDPRDKTLQSREDAECARITAEWEAAKASSGSNT